jgi:hypothetical protein
VIDRDQNGIGPLVAVFPFTGRSSRLIERAEGRGKREEGRGKRAEEEGRGKRKEGRGRRKREEERGQRKKEEGRGRGKSTKDRCRFSGQGDQRERLGFLNLTVFSFLFRLPSALFPLHSVLVF